MSEAEARAIREEPRFRGIQQFHSRKTRTVYADVCGRESGYVGKSDIEAAMQGVLRQAAKRVYGGPLKGHRVFCPDLISLSAVRPIFRQGGEAVFLDVSPEDWGMDPDVLEIAFERYPEGKLVIMTHLYGFPGQAERIREICEAHGALLIEDASESSGAMVNGRLTGSFGDYVVLSADTAGKPGSLEKGIAEERAPFWRNVIAKKKAIYERYRERFSEDLMALNPIGEGAEPNFWTPCMTVESSIGFCETRTENGYEYVSRHGTAAPMEIVESLAAFGVKACPVRRPMHMRECYRNCDQITLDGSKRDYESAGHHGLFVRCNESADIFRKGICLPAEIGMTKEEQDRVIDIIFACYSEREFDRKAWAVV